MINSIINSTRKSSLFCPLSQSLFRRVSDFGCFNVKSSSAQRWRSIEVGSFQSSSLAKTASTMNQGSTLKPPNLLVLSEDVSRFEEVKSCLMQTGFSQFYCIYRLPKEKLLARLWMTNCRLLIVLDGKLDESLYKAVEEYLSAAGNVLSFSPNLFRSNGRAVTDVNFVEVFLEDKNTSTAKFLFSPNVDNSVNIAVDKSGKPLVQFVNLNGGKLVVSGVELFDGIGDDGSRDTLTTILGSHFDLKVDASKLAMKWTPIYLHGINEAKMSQFVDVLSNLANSGRLRNLSIAEVTLEDGDKIPLFLSSNESSFDIKTFRQHLSSSILAQVIIYADVLPTTMTILDQVVSHLPSDFSAIVIAAQQSSGLGRSGNAWLSPLGAAMFTLHFSTTLESELGRRLSVTQHLVALAVVEAVTERIGYENVGIRIKWPNDLLHGQTGAKLGGILVKSSIMGKSVQCAIGCGINLANNKPTTCLNDLAKKEGEVNPLSREEFIARVVTKFESVVRDYTDPRARSSVFQRYCKYWIHSDHRVTVDRGDGSAPISAIVIGIDEYGFLKATADDGESLTLHPDGNSFDLFRNLIVSK